MKKKVNIVLLFIISILIIGSITAYFLLNKKVSNEYGCEEILTQVDACWDNRNSASQDIINCWEAPVGYKNICEDLEIRTYMDTYWKCDELRIEYFPPSRFANITEIDPTAVAHIPPEGQVSFECPSM